MQEKPSPLARPLVCGLLASLCCLLWGSAIPFINLGYRLFAIGGGDTPAQLLFAGLRFFSAGVLTVLLASCARRRLAMPRRDSAGRVAKLAAVQTVLQYVFFYIGVAHTKSVEGSILQGLGAFVSILIACFVFRDERMNALKWLGGLAGAAGVVLVNLGGESGRMSLAGEGCIFLSMTASALSAGMIRRYGKYDDPVALSGWQFMLGGAVMAALGAGLGGQLTPTTPLAWGVLAYLAALSAIAYTLWAVLLRANPVSRVAVYTFLQPIFGVLLALLFEGGGAMPVSAGRCAAALALVCLSIALVDRGQREDA